MAQISISLPDDRKKWAEARVAEGGYADVDEYLSELVRQDEEYERRLKWLRVELEKGLASDTSERNLQDIYDDVRRKRAAA